MHMCMHMCMNIPVHRIHDVFRKWDADGSGMIDEKELGQARAAMGTSSRAGAGSSRGAPAGSVMLGCAFVWARAGVRKGGGLRERGHMLGVKDDAVECRR